MFDGQTILVTGGAGSFGTAFTEHVLESYNPRQIRVFSRDEWKPAQLRERIGDDRLRTFVGDVRDRDRLELACEGVDVVIHAAALKRVDVGELEPEEFKKTNLDGTYNVCHAARRQRVAKVVYLSTDKASGPSTSYGTTKLAGEHATISFGAYRSPRHPTLYAATRYGNVMGSRGSVVPYFRLLAAQGAPLPITNPKMSRFYMQQSEAVALVLLALDRMQGGERFIPKLPSFRIVDLAEAIAPGGKREIVGIREAEKISETLISRDETQFAWDCGDCYVLGRQANGRPVPNTGWEYSSETAPRLTVGQLRERLKDV